MDHGGYDTDLSALNLHHGLRRVNRKAWEAAVIAGLAQGAFLGR